MPQTRDLLVAALALVLLPFVLTSLGMGITSATEVVIFALACMALNILVGYSGLTSFGHGAWFGLAAYAAAMGQRDLFPGSFFAPLALGLGVVIAIAWGFGFLILRRRGVYFSLLTLALSAMLYSVAFRWTEVTGGENGLGGITRPVLAGVSFDSAATYYALVAGVAFMAVLALWRFHRSPLGTVLVAIRENEQRARFVGYPTNRVKLTAFVVSAALTGLAGMLLAFNNRMTSAEPISVAFSGELLAMVIIGGMRSFLGPALGALFFVIFRDSLSRVTENWLLFFGILFVAFIVFSPTGLVGLYERATARWRKTVVDDAAMAQRLAGTVTLPEFLRPPRGGDEAILVAEGLGKSFGGIRALKDVSLRLRDRTLHALIGPNGAGKTTAFNLISGLFAPDRGTVTLAGRPIAGLSPEAITEAGIGRSFQITNLFATLSVAENIRLAVQARHPLRFAVWTDAAAMADVNRDAAEVLRTMGLGGVEGAQAGSLSYGGQRLLDMALALATRPRVLLLDEPLAGLAAAERERVGLLIKGISTELPVLLVEHDIDRVFALADAVTVMNDGEVLVDGTVDDARDSPQVQAVYIGAGSHALAAIERASAAQPSVLLKLDGVNTFYGKSHILHDVGFEVHDREIVALLGRNGAGKSTLLKTIIGVSPPASGQILLGSEALARRPSSEIARRGVAYVPQGRGLFAGMSVAENMELGRLKRRNQAGTYWDEDKIFSFFPRIKERWRSPADYLSGGEQQMVAVARALSGDTRVLLLDEPFEGLAPAIVEELFEAFDKLRHEVAILIVDHHLDLALALSDRTVALERGTVTHIGDSGALSRDLELRRKVLWL
ncbi:branched-chain amino acid ABC transporter ATP-binding protein/permease [Ideonella sp. A 288]|uniref:branched-chain amino acid ABC transporter ATP-binding protein/permease n=1 Tax=Ideonella sp. A 288 TaxID=1962181 RepID=UPI000B4C123E|nr:branched-chain amino acid ABC transporter ATP-binding protein/permease [Ideonella sp. A 288]